MTTTNYPTQSRTSVPNTHAHNDYEHDYPLFDALSYGFRSVEADIWLYANDDNNLRVAHDPVFNPSNLPTLEDLYLTPLKNLKEKFNNGGVYADSTPITLLIDIKSSGESTYERLHQVLSEYEAQSPGLFTTYTRNADGEYTIKSGAVTAIISGNRPRSLMESQELRYAGYDGRKSDIAPDAEAGFIRLISDNWNNFFSGELAWNGTGTIPEDTQAELNKIVDSVQGQEQIFRIWNLPQDAPSVWQPLYQAGVDLINTDNLPGLSNFLRAELGLIPPATTLVGWASLPADTLAPGPQSGLALEAGPFAGQPIGGLSGVQFADHDSYYYIVDTLVDDSLLRIYQLKPDFSRADGGSGQVLVEKFINLSDPNKLVPFPIKNGQTKERILTAEDFDTESLVVGQDGSFWVGDEYGPFLLHFSSTGVLLQAPIPTPNLGINGSLGGLVQSPNNPLLNNSAEANLRGSRGFESIAYSPDRRYLYPMLEATVNGDPADSIRIYQYDTQTQTYADKLVGLYQLEHPGNTPPFQTGDLTPINNHEFLVIERDDFQGDKAFFKKVFKIDISQKDANGFVQKEEVIDLLSISDPQDLNKDGEQNFSLPITSIEDILVLNPTTVLVAVDNNFPFPDYGSGRPPELDNNEMILVGLDKPLNLDLALGQPTPPPPSEVFGTPGDDDFDSVLGTDGFIGKGQNIFTSSGNDTIDVSQALGGNRIDAGSGDDLIFAGTNNRILAGSGADRIFLGYPGGNNVVTGGSGADQFWLVTDEGDLPTKANTITDFTIGSDVIGFAGTNLNFAALDIIQTGANTTINALGRDLAVLQNVQASLLTASNFVFA